MDNRPIGVFDSGVGGLTTVRELHKILPEEDIIYLGDTGRVPYGTRSRETIRKYAAQDIAFLASFGVKAIVAACGTVSAYYKAEDVREMGIETPFYNVVQPACRTACNQTVTGRIGIMATPASIRSGVYCDTIRSMQPDAQTFGSPGSLLVPLVENGFTDFHNKITRLTLELYLQPLVEQNIDTLILGCTHYPMLYDIINDMLGDDIILIDSGAAAAREVTAMLYAGGGLASRKKGKTSYYVTDTVSNFVSVAHNFLFDNVEENSTHIDIEAIDIAGGG